MTRLGDQIEELSHEVDLLLAGHDNRRVIEQIETAIDELEPTSTSLERALGNRRVLRTSPRDFRLDTFADEEERLCVRLRQSYASMRKAWLEDPASLRQRGHVAQFRQSSENYRAAVDRNNEACWSSWIQDLEQQFLVAGPQLESIRNVLDYRDPIARYKQGVDQFSVLTRAIPDDEAGLNAIRVLASSLRGIREGFIFDLPKVVVSFYDALDRDGSIPLIKLTPEVADWLQKNDGVRDLAIIRRRVPRQ